MTVMGMEIRVLEIKVLLGMVHLRIRKGNYRISGGEGQIWR